MLKTLETSRLILRPFTLGDVAAIFEFGSNPEVQKFTGSPILKTTQEAKALITNVYFKDYAAYGYGRFATIYKPDNKLIGFAGLKYLPFYKEADLVYRFLPQYWGKGIATEASEAILDYGFNTLKLKRIIAATHQENIGSSKVLEKVGFTFTEVAGYEDEGGQYNWYEKLAT